MAYNPTVWEENDLLSIDRMNKIEQGIAAASEPPDGLLPTGGTTGQMLTKASDNDFDAEWTDVPQNSNSSGKVYSTEETRIGTWIDGKPLYRKCSVLSKENVTGLSKTNTKEVTILIDSVNTIAHIGGKVYRSGTVTCFEFNNTIPSTYCFYADFSKYSNNTLTVLLKGSESNAYTSVEGGLLVVEYTKNTDTTS